MRDINRIIVHCSASPDFEDIGVKQIDQWHKDRGFKAPSGIHCGYHYVIRRNGTVEVGRMMSEIGAHCEGENSDSVGVCLVGTHEFNQNQIDSLRRVIDGVQEFFPDVTVHEHREFPSAKAQKKTCPNFNVRSVLGI